ncbi:MAG: hypothetical protein U0Q18_17975 [Bryobacteraceae bacterium]
MGKFLRPLLLAGALGSAFLFSACSAHVGYGYRVYDPYYRDYHYWGPDDNWYYNRWAVEHHHENREYRRLKHEDQRQYWNWRHAQPPRNHDRDHDRDRH